MARYNYDLVATFYDGAAAAYSLGGIRRSKRAAIAHAKPGDRVLFLGSGSGWDAMRAAKRGADVTCLDVSPAMLDRAKARFEAAGLSGNFVCEDMMEHDAEGGYDVVFGNYFFNLFAPETMRLYLAQAARMVRPNGLLIIADVAPPTGPAPVRLFKWAYLQGALGIFWLMGLISWHPINDYVEEVRKLELGLKLKSEDRIAWFSGGPVLFRSLAFAKPAASHPGP